jgi:YD repeat-containing protein
VGEQDLNGVSTSLGYDLGNRLTTVTDAAGRAIRFTYASNAKIATATDPLGRVVGYGYEGQAT